MGPFQVLLYVAAASGAIILTGLLVGHLRSRRVRPGLRRLEEESPLGVARRRYEAGQIGERELEQVRRHARAA
jgi:hypothetical protein